MPGTARKGKRRRLPRLRRLWSSQAPLLVRDRRREQPTDFFFSGLHHLLQQILQHLQIKNRPTTVSVLLIKIQDGAHHPVDLFRAQLGIDRQGQHFFSGLLRGREIAFVVTQIFETFLDVER